MSILKVSAINNEAAGSGGLAISADGLVSGAGMDLITSSTFSAVASVSVNSCFTSDYDNYSVMLVISSLTADANIFMRLRASGTDDSSATYNWGGQKVNSAAAQALIGGSSQTAWFIGDSDTGTTDEYMAKLDLCNPNAVLKTAGVGLWVGNNSVGAPHGQYHGFVHRTAAAYDGFTFYPASGNFTGTVRVYGYRN